MSDPLMHKYSYPIETPEALKFWASRHICNRVKAIIAFSLSEEDALRNLRNGLPKDFSHNHYHFRKRAVRAWSSIVNTPSMTNVPFTPLGIPWWECIPDSEVPPEVGDWARWKDSISWTDDNRWIEWIGPKP